MYIDTKSTQTNIGPTEEVVDNSVDVYKEFDVIKASSKPKRTTQWYDADDRIKKFSHCSLVTENSAKRYDKIEEVAILIDSIAAGGEEYTKGQFKVVKKGIKPTSPFYNGVKHKNVRLPKGVMKRLIATITEDFIDEMMIVVNGVNRPTIGSILTMCGHICNKVYQDTIVDGNGVSKMGHNYKKQARVDHETINIASLTLTALKVLTENANYKFSIGKEGTKKNIGECKTYAFGEEYAECKNNYEVFPIYIKHNETYKTPTATKAPKASNVTKSIKSNMTSETKSNKGHQISKVQGVTEGIKNQSKDAYLCYGKSDEEEVTTKEYNEWKRSMNGICYFASQKSRDRRIQEEKNAKRQEENLQGRQAWAIAKGITPPTQ